jgi:hypothetical protein
MLSRQRRTGMAVMSTAVFRSTDSATRASFLVPAVALLGAPILFMQGATHQFQPYEPDRFWGALEVLYILGWMTSIIALIRLSATGRSIAGRAILGVQLIALTLAATESVLIAMVPNLDHSTILYQITDIAWPFSHMFMLVVATTILVVRVLPGWQRITPLLCGLVLPFSLVGLRLGDDFGGRLAFGLGTAVAFGLLAWAVRRAW